MTRRNGAKPNLKGTRAREGRLAGAPQKRLLLTCVLLTAALAAILVGGPAAMARTPRLRVGFAVRLPLGARVGAALPASRRLALTVALAPQDPAALQAFATAISTPGSPEFHQYLTVSEFAQRFGAPKGHIAAVQQALRADGLSVGVPSANDLTVSVSGTTAQVENAFSVSEAQVRLRGGRIAYANRQAPVLPASVAGDVQGVMGLDNVTIDQPQDVSTQTHARRVRVSSVRHPSAVRPHAIGSGPAPCPEAVSDSTGANTSGPNQSSELGYTQDEAAGAYGLTSYYPATEGQGVSVGLLEEEPYQASDVAAYQSCYGTSAVVTNVNVGQGVAAYTAGDDDGEAALDIEQVIGLAPKANIIVYQEQGSATSAADLLTAMVSQDQAKVLSSSYGGCEALTDQSVINSENTTLQEAAAQGQSFFISSGDSGSTHCYQSTASTSSPNYSLSVLDPAAQPFATGVGGTSMGTVSNNTWVVPDNGSYPGEFVWNDGDPNGVPNRSAASGGGVSDQWPMPSYQSSAASSLNAVSADSARTCGGQLCRQVPDVSADGDYFNSGYTFYYNGGSTGGGWNVNAGTSAAAPLWAAFTALADSSPACRGFSLGFLNPALYQVADGSYLTNFHDITQNSPFSGYYGTDLGNDTFAGQNSDNPSQLYPVGTGYDMATGLGTPIANVLGNSLCAVRAPVYSVAVTSPGNQATTVGQVVDLTVRAADSGNAAVTYAASGLPAGLTLNASTGQITGTPTTAQTASVTVSATDAFTNAGSTVFTWTIANVPPPAPVVAPVVVGVPTAKSVKISGLVVRRPKLSFTLAAGPNAAALKSVALTLPTGLSFATKLKTLEKGITLKAGTEKLKFSISLKKGVLTLTFRSSTRSATLTVVRPAITITRSEATKIAKHKVRQLTFHLKTVDTSKRVITLSVTLKKLS
jgi:subtilase family serine protease